MEDRSATVLSLLVVLMVAPSASAQAPLTTNPEGLAAMGLLDLAFNQHKVAEAFARYVGPTYSQNGGPDAKQAAIRYLGAAVANNPDYRYDFQRVLIDRDVAAVYAYVYAKKGDLGSKVVDFFRFENGKIVDHWDVTQSLAPRPPLAN